MTKRHSVQRIVPALTVVVLIGVLAMSGVAAADDPKFGPQVETTGLDAAEPDSSATVDGAVNVSLVPANDSVAPGENVTYDILVTGPDAGISSYDVTVSLANDEVASIVDVASERESGFGVEEVLDDGAEAQLERALGDETFDPSEEILLGSVTVSADAVGNTTLAVATDSDINDLDSEQYDIAAAPEAALSIEEDVLEGTLAVEPAEESAVIDFTRSYDIVLVGADEGVSSFDLSASLDGQGSAEIVDADTTGEEVLDDVAIGDDGQSLSVTQAQLDDTVAPADSAVLVTVDIEMQSLGNVSLDVDEVTVTGVNDTSYVLETASGSIEIIEPPQGPDVTGDGASASDTTGDGRTNDVVGDGEFRITDVQELFRLIATGEIETIEGADEFFDFSDDGDVGISDVQALFQEFQEQAD